MLSQVDAEAGFGALYYTDDDVQYTAAVYQFPTKEDAATGLSFWMEEGTAPQIYIVRKKFALMVFGPDREKAYSLAANSPGITEEDAREGNEVSK